MSTAEVTTENGRQIVHLPDDVRLQDGTVLIKKVGRSLLLVPHQSDSWQSMLASLDSFSDDFMDERRQPELDQRVPAFE